MKTEERVQLLMEALKVLTQEDDKDDRAEIRKLLKIELKAMSY